MFSGGFLLPRASLPRSLRGDVIASSSSQQGARKPPPDERSAFYSLTDKCVVAGALNRHLRGAELSAHAAEKAEALHGVNSLVVAELWMNESKALNNLSKEARGAEQEVLLRRSRSALLSVVALLQRRLEANTLLPGTVRKEESDYYAHVQAARFSMKSGPVPPQAVLLIIASTIGYKVLLEALSRSLHFTSVLLQPLWSDEHRKVV